MFQSELRQVASAIREHEVLGAASIDAAEAVVQSFVPVYARTMEQLVKGVFESVGGALLDSLMRRKAAGDEFVRRIQDYLNQFGLAKAQGMSMVTRARILSELRIAVAAGEGTLEAAARFEKGISGVGKLSARNRALTIARTEVHSASIASLESAVDAADLKPLREWATTQDSRARNEHRAADGQVRKWKEPFIVAGESLLFPGDPAGSAGNTVNCRCQILYRTQKEIGKPKDIDEQADDLFANVRNRQFGVAGARARLAQASAELQESVLAKARKAIDEMEVKDFIKIVDGSPQRSAFVSAKTITFAGRNHTLKREAQKLLEKIKYNLDEDEVALLFSDDIKKVRVAFGNYWGSYGPQGDLGEAIQSALRHLFKANGAHFSGSVEGLGALGVDQINPTLMRALEQIRFQTQDRLFTVHGADLRKRKLFRGTAEELPQRNIAESWSDEQDVAMSFGGIIKEMLINPERVLMTYKTHPRLFRRLTHEKEWVMMCC